MSSLNPKGILILSALDKLISEHKANAAMVCALFEQKESVIGLLQSAKLDAAKYVKIVAKAYKEETGVVRACAEQDVQQLQNPKDPHQVQAWFKLMVDNTGINYEKQQKLYKHYQAQLSPAASVQPTAPQKQEPPVPQKQQPPPNSQKPKEAQQKSKMPGPHIQEIVSFKSLDQLMDDEDKAENYQKWYDRKKKLWDLALRKELTAQKYKATLQIFCNRLKGTGLASSYSLQLSGIEDFHHGNVNKWFKEVIDETKDNFQTQTQKLNALLKGPAKKQPVAQQAVTQQKLIRQSLPVKGSASSKPFSFDIAQINSFKVLDESLEQQTQNKNNYKEVLQKKKKLLQHAKKGVLTAQKYKALLQKSISEVRNEQIRQTMEFQLTQLRQFHDNNLNEWFKDIVSGAELTIEDQEQGLKLLQQGKKIQKKEDSDGDIDMKFLNGDDDDDFEMPIDHQQIIEIKPETTANPNPKKQAISPPKKQEPLKQANSNQYSDFFSLKALDQIMSQNQSNPQIFCQCFERKQDIFAMMQRGEIDAQKYKALQQKCLKSSSNSKQKQCIEMDLFDLKDMCAGNCDEWFQSLINDSGDNFEEQQERYQKFKAKGQPVASTEAKQPQRSSEIQQKPNIGEVACFSALPRLFEYSIKTADIVYYKQVIGKRQKLMQLVGQKRLVAGKYRQINKVTTAKTQNLFLKSIILDQLETLASKFKGDEQAWFASLKEKLLAAPPELKLPSNPLADKINALPIQDKIQYIAKRMAPYESLVAYYRTNQLNPADNPNIQTYLKKKKKQLFQAIPFLQKDAHFDLFNLVQQLFPPVDSEVFYAGTLPALKKKAESFAGAFAQEIAALKDYSTKIKKATNPQNLQNTRKEIAQCEQNIAALKGWPGKQLIPLPTVTQQKAERYNLDINTHLDHNQVQINITYIEGMGSDTYLKIYAVQTQNERFWAKVKNGPQGNAKTIIKLPQKEMADLIKGDKPLLTIKFFEKTFFGNWKLISECMLAGVSFGRNNIAEDKAVAGDIRLNYEMRVRKPTKPLVTEIPHATFKVLPAFEVDGSAVKQLIKQCLAQLKQ